MILLLTDTEGHITGLPLPLEAWGWAGLYICVKSVTGVPAIAEFNLWRIRASISPLPTFFSEIVQKGSTEVREMHFSMVRSEKE